MNVKISDRTIYPHLSIDELISRWPGSDRPEETKRKLSELIKNYFKIFPKIQITSQDQTLLLDVFTLLNDQGTASDWNNTQTMLYGQFVPFHRCTYSRVQDVAPTTNNGGLNNKILSAIIPNEIWGSIFNFVDWKSWLNLHLVSKASQQLASSIISGYKLIGHLKSIKTSEDPEIIILSDFTWRRSPNDIAVIKEYMPDVESVLNDKIQLQTPLPTFVPLLNARELLRVFAKLKKKNSHNGNGVSFDYNNTSFYVYYLKQADLFAIVTTRSTRTGCMGAPNNHTHEELFYYPGDVVTIEVPAIRYKVEYYRGAIIQSSLVSLEDPPRTHFKRAFK